MAALSSVFLRPRALMANPYTTGARREDFMRTTGVYKVAMVGGGGGGGGSSDNGLYYGAAGNNAVPVFATIRTRGGEMSVLEGGGGRAGNTGAAGGTGGQTYLYINSTTVAVASAGTGGVSGNSAANYERVFSPEMRYRIIAGGARPIVDFNPVSGGTVHTSGKGGGSGLAGRVGGIFYNLMFRVA